MDSVLGSFVQLGVGAAFGAVALWIAWRMIDRNHEYQLSLARRLENYDQQMQRLVRANTMAMCELTAVIREALGGSSHAPDIVARVHRQADAAGDE